ncbi:unnamed protein product [Cochlearia groenlandica]
MAEDGAESKHPVNPMADDGAESKHPVKHVVDDTAESKRTGKQRSWPSVLRAILVKVDNYKIICFEYSFFVRMMTPKKNWPPSEKGSFGWLVECHLNSFMHMLRKRSMANLTPFTSLWISFIDQLWVNCWHRDYSFEGLSDENMPFTRKKMIVEIYDEVPDDHNQMSTRFRTQRTRISCYSSRTL